MDLANRIALVTAGSRGLGAEVVVALARAGADVAFTFVKDAAAAGAVAAQVENIGRRCLPIQADAADYAIAQETTRSIRDRLGGLHILVCNAGVARSAPLWKMTEQDWDAVIDVSLKGSFNYIRAAAPFFIEQRAGKIVCIGSINGLRGRMGTASYNAAKAGLVGLVKTAASELGSYNVNVNLVAPGFIDTPSQASTPELIRDLVLKECAIKRLATPAEIAPLVTFLCSELTRHITGQVIKIDGGQYL